MSPSPRADKRPWALALARRYARFKAGRALDGVRVDGLEQARRLGRETPLLIAANHVSFWDAFLMVLLDEALETDGYVLMDRASLERLPFMGPLGALPLDRSQATTALRDLDEAASLLDRPGRALWIYPQGDQRPHHLRPLCFKRGVQRLAERASAPVLPVALAYHFADAPEPAARVRIGAPLEPSAPDLTLRLEAQVADMLDGLDAAFLTRAPPERLLTPARSRSPERGLGARLLGGRTQS